MDQDLGLWKRGLALFGLVALIAVVVLWMLLSGSPTPATRTTPPIDSAVAINGTLGAPFPANVHWAALYRLGATLPSAPGWEVRYNATLALARRGSPHLPLPVLAEMLDEDQQRRNFRVQLVDGRDAPDEGAAARTVLNALKALADWHKHSEVMQKVKAANAEIEKVYVAVDRLTQSPNLAVRAEAEQTRKTLGRP